MAVFRAMRFACGAAVLAACLAASAAPAPAQEIRCTTVGAETKCTEIPPQAQPTPSVPAEARPPVTNLGRSGPTRYERENLRIFGADNQIRLLGNAEQKAGQQGAPLNSGRNCATFNTSVFCD
ncbi:MAG: hypothetical protein ACT4N4_12975 [Rhodospirillales bacterium]